MKKFAKLIPVALGLLTLASCSNDDFFDKTDSQDFENLGKGDLVVYNVPLQEDGNAFTRAWRSDDTQYRKWGREDEMRVYDGDLHKYDIYSFQAGGTEKSAFRLSTSKVDANGVGVSNITEAKYAIFPKQDVLSGHWDYNEKSGQTRTLAMMQIPSLIRYDGTNYQIPGTSTYIPVFEDAIPMWGPVQATEKGYLEVGIQPLTGVLRLRLGGTPEYAQFIKVMMYDHETGYPIDMNGEYITCLATDEVPDLEACLATNGTIQPNTDGSSLNADGTGKDWYNFLASLNIEDYNQKEVDVQSPQRDAIYVNMIDPSHDFDQLNPEWKTKSVVYVPLVTTPGRTVDIVAYAAYQKLDDEGDPTGDWVEKEIMRFKNKTIEAGHLYGNGTFFNLAVDGYDPCSINEALETATPKDNIIMLKTQNAIGCTKECHTILIPKMEGVDKIIIDMSKGLFNGNYPTLDIKYLEDNEGKRFEGDVAIIAQPAPNGEGGTKQRVNINVELSKSGFGLAGTGFNALSFDADEVILGDGETLSGNIIGNGYNMPVRFSDNVQKLTVNENACFGIGNPATHLINIPEIDSNDLGDFDWTEDGKFTNANLKEIKVMGILLAQINAPEEEVKIVVGEDNPLAPMETPALLLGSARTKYNGGPTDAAISALGRAALVEINWPVSEGDLTPVSDGQTRGFGSYGNIVVTGKSFITGPAFSKKGDIKISNVDLQPGNGDNELGTFLTDGKKLSDIVFFNGGGSSNIFVNAFRRALKPGVYGPLYAEEGSVKIEATNSKLKIIETNSYNPAQLAWPLANHPQETTYYSVYAAQDIEIGTTDWETNAENSMITIAKREGDVESTVKGIWAEDDVELFGNTQVTQDVRADDEFTIEDISTTQNVQVGHIATIDVAPQDGKCQAVENNLTFVKNALGNQLFLQQGYVYTVKNQDVPVSLVFSDEGAFAAIGLVEDPDNLVPTNTSIWNGEYMDPALVQYFVTRGEGNDNIWTATELAQQSVYDKTTTIAPIIRSNINLANKPWKGISFVNLDTYTITGFGDEPKEISGINIVGDPKNTEATSIGYGFINQVKNLKASNLQLTATTNIAPTNGKIDGVGGLAGVVMEDANVDHVTVLLSGNIGNDGVNNLQLENVGGVFGKTCKNVSLKGVRVGGAGASLNAYAGIGGFIGAATNIDTENGNKIEIADALATDELGAKQTAVNNLKIKVTYVKPDSDDNPGIAIADTKQGMTGLYIGTVGFSTTNVDINVTEDDVEELYTLEGVYDLSKAYWTQVNEAGFTIGDDPDHTYTFVKFVFAHGSQSLIGQSGDIELTKSKARLNGKFYYVKKTGHQSYVFTNALYVLVGKDGVVKP